MIEQNQEPSQEVLLLLQGQNETIASLKAENEKLEQQNKELRQQVATERSHKLAYQKRLRELEPPPNERTQEQSEPQYTYEQPEFWENLKNLSDDEKYEISKKFVDEFEDSLQVEKQSILTKACKPFKDKQKQLQAELAEKLKENVGFFGKKQHDKEVKSLRDKIKSIETDMNNKKPAPVPLDTQARGNIEKASNIENLWYLVQQAKSYVRDYEQEQKNKKLTVF